jgi:quercetin dioxygenase-like cupin family protein
MAMRWIMKLRTALLFTFLSGTIAAFGVTLAREPGTPSMVVPEQLIAEALAGEDNKEVVVQLYTFPPGTVLPWHIHPDAHEIAYVLQGTLTFQRAGEQPRDIKTGEADYLAPNIVHRGMNNGDVPVKLYVVRIKPKDKPLLQEVPAPR